MLSTFVDHLATQVLKPFPDLFPASALPLAHWLRHEAVEQVLVPVLILYLQSDLIQFQLQDNIKLIVKTLGALTAASLNIGQLVERALAPAAAAAVQTLLQERLANLRPTKDPLKKGLDSLFQVEGYKLLTQQELEERKAEESYERVLVFQPLRRQFFRKMVRFLDKHLRVAALQEGAPYLAGEIAH